MNTKIAYSIAGALLLALGLFRFMLFMTNREANAPDKPIKYNPTMFDRWENDQGYLEVRRDERRVEGKLTFQGFERKIGDGPAERGAIVNITSSLDLPGEKGDSWFYVLQDDKVLRKDRYRWKFNAETMKLVDEAGKETLYRRAPKKEAAAVVRSEIMGSLS